MDIAIFGSQNDGLILFYQEIYVRDKNRFITTKRYANLSRARRVKVYPMFRLFIYE